MARYRNRLDERVIEFPTRNAEVEMWPGTWELLDEPAPAAAPAEPVEQPSARAEVEQPEPEQLDERPEQPEQPEPVVIRTRPAKRDGADEWRAFAASLGVEGADELTKAEAIAAVEALDD